MGERFEVEYSDYDGSEWYYFWRGGGTIKSERSEEARLSNFGAVKGYRSYIRRAVESEIEKQLAK